jgi:imidazole glycerol-phosphate synthase subunit HisH
MKKPSIAIVDYGVGNLNSVANMIRRSGAEAHFVRNAAEVQKAERLVLPGVGAFDTCRRALDQIDGLEMAIRDAVERGVPLLGICVGMQMLATSSEEGSLAGLDLVPGCVRRFDLEETAGSRVLRVPHMAWCPVEPCGRSTLFKGDLSEINRFYFVHSYYFECANAEDISGVAFHGHEFTAAVERGSVHGVQFHPEKSHRYGLALFRNFAALPVGRAHD